MLSRTIRQISQRSGRRSIGSLVNAPNNVPLKQKQFTANPHLHGAENPTYLKGDNDKLVCVAGAVLSGIGLIQLGRGFYNMSLGIGKNE